MSQTIILTTVEGRKKTNWKPVISHLKWRKGKPLTLESNNKQVSILHRGTYGYNPAWGYATVIVACGFCNVEHKVFKWSLAGGGKRCTCCGSKITTTHSIAWLDKKTPPEILKMIKEPPILTQTDNETRI